MKEDKLLQNQDISIISFVFPYVCIFAMDTIQWYISFSGILTLLGYKIHIEYQTQQADKKDNHHGLILGDIGRLMDSACCIDRLRINWRDRSFGYFLFRYDRRSSWQRRLCCFGRITSCRGGCKVVGMIIDPFLQCR
jgi:hypothetical protein